MSSIKPNSADPSAMVVPMTTTKQPLELHARQQENACSPAACAMAVGSAVSGSPSGVPAGRFAPYHVSAPRKGHQRQASTFSSAAHANSPTADNTLPCRMSQQQKQQNPSQKRGAKCSPAQLVPPNKSFSMAPMQHPMHMHGQHPQYPIMPHMAPTQPHATCAWGGGMPLHGHGDFHHPITCAPMVTRPQELNTTIKGGNGGHSLAVSDHAAEVIDTGAGRHPSNGPHNASGYTSQATQRPDDVGIVGAAETEPTAHRQSIHTGGHRALIGAQAVSVSVLPRTEVAHSTSAVTSEAAGGGSSSMRTGTEGAQAEIGNQRVATDDGNVSGKQVYAGVEHPLPGSLSSRVWADSAWATALARAGSHFPADISHTPRSKPTSWWDNHLHNHNHILASLDSHTHSHSHSGNHKIITTAPSHAPLLSLRAVDLSSPSYGFRSHGRTLTAAAVTLTAIGPPPVGVAAPGATTTANAADVHRTDSSLSLDFRSEHQALTVSQHDRVDVNMDPHSGGASAGCDGMGAVIAASNDGVRGKHLAHSSPQLVWYQQQVALLQQRLAESEQDRRELSTSLRKAAIAKRHLREAREQAAALQMRVCHLVQEATASSMARDELRATVERLTAEVTELRQQKAHEADSQPKTQELLSELERQRDENLELQEQLDQLFDETEHLKRNLAIAAQRKEYDELKISQLKQALRGEHATREHLGALLHAAESARQHEHLPNGPRAAGGGLVLNFHDNTMTIATPDADV